MEIEVATGDAWSIRDICHNRSHSIVEDGSLPSGGFEINTSPAQGDLFCEVIEELCRKLKYAGGDINDDCGLHVHIDARDYTQWELRKLIKLYAKLEPALFQMMPASRRESDYCEPCADRFMKKIDRVYAQNKRAKVREMRNAVPRAFYGTVNTRPYRNDQKPDGRRKALNLHSWFYRKSVECRLHEGTISKNDIIPWGILWASILDRANLMTEREVSFIDGSSYDVLMDIAPNALVKDYVKNRTKMFGDKIKKNVKPQDQITGLELPW